MIKLNTHTHTAVECEPLANIANEMISYSTAGTPNYPLTTVATYSCNAGFSLDLSVGSETRTCIDDGDNDAEGVFDMQKPACVRKSALCGYIPADLITLVLT